LQLAESKSRETRRRLGDWAIRRLGNWEGRGGQGDGETGGSGEGTIRSFVSALAELESFQLVSFLSKD